MPYTLSASDIESAMVSRHEQVLMQVRVTGGIRVVEYLSMESDRSDFVQLI